MRLGADTAYQSGYSIRMSDLVPSAVRQQLFAELDNKEAVIRAKKLPKPEERAELAKIYNDTHVKMVDAVFDESLSKDNQIALGVLTKARGDKTQLAAMLGSPGPFLNAKNELLPVYPKRSYAEGLRPWEHYAAAFGARKGVISTKFSTRQAGYLGKQLTAAAEGLIVTEDDCGTIDGIPVSVKDGDNVGALLAKNTGGFTMGTPLDAKIMQALSAKGFNKILVRSPITCKSSNGICKRCAGLQEDGKFPELRAAIGTKASSSMAERIAQGALNLKHRGGQSSSNASDEPEEPTYAGFEIINQLAQVPGNFRHAAAVADLDGTVSKIEELPQGGWNVSINGTTHFVDPEQRPKVRVGDTVEAGDQLSTGIVNPALAVKYKGIGEGRRYFAERFTQAFRDSNLTVNRRNAEVIARSVVDHVVSDDEQGDILPGDTVTYENMAYNYVPRKDSILERPDKVIGSYLEQPVLHHTIGTRVTKRMAKELADFNIDKVLSNKAEPAFRPEMLSVRSVPHQQSDWMAKLHSSYLMGNLLQDVHRGATSDIHGTHPVPGVAYGIEFGKSKPDKVTY